MSERGISTMRVIDAIRKPDSHRAAGDGAMACVKTFSARQLEVIYRSAQKG